VLLTDAGRVAPSPQRWLPPTWCLDAKMEQTLFALDEEPSMELLKSIGQRRPV